MVASESHHSMNGIKILLVEDDPSLAEMYSMKFQAEGYTILTALNGEEGLEKALAESPALVLLDVMMPKMDGFAVLTELKKDLKTKDIPVVLLSNLGQKADMEKGKQLGAVDYIVKASLTPAELFDKAMTFITNKK